MEWSLADLLFRRARVHSEYIAMDGLAFGFTLEYQNTDERKWRQQSVLFGVSSTQHFQSLGLKGVFLRGEAGLMAATFHEGSVGGDGLTAWHEGSTTGMSLGLDVGYRQPLGKHFVVASAVGGRRLVPDFFRMHQGTQGDRFEEHEGLWSARIDFSLGVAF